MSSKTRINISSTNAKQLSVWGVLSMGVVALVVIGVVLRRDASSPLSISGAGAVAGAVNLFSNSDAEQNLNGYTMPVVDRAFYYDGSVYQDVTQEANSGGGVPFVMLSDTNDYFYIGVRGISGFRFGGMQINLSQTGQGHVLVWEYWNGKNWTLNPNSEIVDGTDSFRKSGSIDFTISTGPTLIATLSTTVNGVTAQWWRVRTMRVPVTPATVLSIQPNPAEIPPSLDHTEAFTGTSSVRFGFEINHAWEKVITFRAQDNYSRFEAVPGDEYVLVANMKSQGQTSGTGQFGMLWFDAYGNLMQADQNPVFLQIPDWRELSRVGVAPLRANFSSVFAFDGTSFLARTTEAGDPDDPPFALFAKTGDIVYLGSPGVLFGEIAIDLESVLQGGEVAWEYWDGSTWTVLGVTGSPAGAEHFAFSGRIVFVPPSDWKQTPLNGAEYYWVRARLVSEGTGFFPTLKQVGWGRAATVLPIWEDFLGPGNIIFTQWIDNVRFYRLSPPQSDIDQDGFSNIVDSCPTKFTSHNTPPGDSDCDGFVDSLEFNMGTSIWNACPSTAVANDEAVDAWPPDFDDNQTVNIIDVLSLKPHFNTVKGNPSYSVRHDLNGDEAINIVDVLALKQFFSTSCVPGT